MPAEWQARQLPLAASAPGPSGNMRSPKGRSTFTDFSANLSAAWAPTDASVMAVMRAIGNSVRTRFSSSGRDDRRRLDDVAHEPAWVPVGRVGLRLAAAAGTSGHQHV